MLFVSHNLKAVTELCTRAMLLKKGEVAIISDADSVVRHYLKDAQEPDVGERASRFIFPRSRSTTNSESGPRLSPDKRPG